MAGTKREDVYRFLESAGGTALITILLGSGGASLVSYYIQTSLQHREQQAAAYQDKLSRRRAVVEEAYDLVGTMITRTEALTELMQADFNPRTYRNGAVVDMENQHVETRANYNETDIEWRSQQVTLTIKVSDALGETAEERWARLAEAVDKFKECVLITIAKENRAIEPPDTVCRCERAKVVEQIRNFSRLVSESMYDP